MGKCREKEKECLDKKKKNRHHLSIKGNWEIDLDGFPHL